MAFVKVRHEDGREADITPEEVEYYGTIGFKPVDESGADTQVDGETVELREPDKTGAPAKPSGKTG